MGKITAQEKIEIGKAHKLKSIIEDKKAGLTEKEIAEKNGVSIKTLRRTVADQKAKDRVELAKKLQEDKRDGLTNWQISEKHDLPETTVRTLLAI